MFVLINQILSWMFILFRCLDFVSTITWKGIPGFKNKKKQIYLVTHAFSIQQMLGWLQSALPRAESWGYGGKQSLTQPAPTELAVQRGRPASHKGFRKESFDAWCCDQLHGGKSSVCDARVAGCWGQAVHQVSRWYWGRCLGKKPWAADSRASPTAAIKAASNELLSSLSLEWGCAVRALQYRATPDAAAGGGLAICQLAAASERASRGSVSAASTNSGTILFHNTLRNQNMWSNPCVFVCLTNEFGKITCPDTEIKLNFVM